MKVRLAAEDVQFEGWVVGDVQYKISEYWVYMAKGSKRLTVKTKGYLPLDIEFSDYQVNTLESKVTYQLVISKPQDFNGQASLESGSQGSGMIPSSQVFMVNGVSFEMVWVEGGTFVMGATDEQSIEAESIENPAHKVTLKNYFMGLTEVTQALWEAVMGENPSRFEDENRPVERVSWTDCQYFIDRLNRLTGKEFRLPTEAEWEYAARGGKKSRGYKYSGSNNVDEVACYIVTSNEEGTKPVATKQANELGLYDMSGNVYEWCQDGYGDYSGHPQTNPTGSNNAVNRVFRGGCWGHGAENCRVSYRDYGHPDNKINSLGFRLVLP